MALEMFDGFEIYGTSITNLLLGRWSASSAPSLNTTTPTPRTGTYRLDITPPGTETQATLRYLRWVFASGAKATRYYGFAWQATSLTTGTLFQVMDGAIAHVTLRYNSDGTLQVFRGDTVTGTSLGTSTLTLAINTWYYIELKVTVNDATGEVVVKVDETTFINLTGVDTRNAGNASADGFQFAAGLRNNYYDDCYADDAQFQGSCRVYPVVPSADGNSSVMLGSDGNSLLNYQLVDEIPPNLDTDYVASSVTGDKDTYGMSNLPGGVLGPVRAVQAHAFARKTDVAVRAIRNVIRSGGVDYEGVDKTLTTSYAYYSHMWETDPATAAAWLPTGVDAFEMGTKVQT
jgi:hypothetical protein